VEHVVEEAKLRGCREGPKTKKKEKLEHGCYILGDCVCSARKWLLVPKTATRW
jgi:hypothetical protein